MKTKPVMLLGVLVVLAAATGVEAVEIRGQISGDTGWMSWRKPAGDRLGWCTVRLYRDGLLRRTTRSNAGSGQFTFSEVEPGRVELAVSRPGFQTVRRVLELDAVDPPPLEIRLTRDPDYGLIVLPRTGMAVTRVPGETFLVECLAPPGADGWSARLATEHFTRPLVIESASYGNRTVWHGTKAGWRLAVRVEPGTPAEMYRLQVAYSAADGVIHAAEQSSAVCIRSSYTGDFALMPYQDFHFNWLVGKPGAAGETQADYFRAASLIHPLFVSLGDDVGFEGDDHVAMFHYLVSRELRVPVYLAFGNHDAGLGTDGFEFYFGPRWQTRRIGPHAGIIISYDLYQGDYEMPPEQRRFVNGALRGFESDPNNRLIFLAGHRHAWQSPLVPFFDLPFDKKTRTRFRGGDGGTAVEFQRLFMDPLSVSSMHGWADLNYTGRVMYVEDWRRAVLEPQRALPAVEFDEPNDGTRPTLGATVRLLGQPRWQPPENLYQSGHFSKMPQRWEGFERIRNARLRFVMPKGRYRTSAGRIVQQVDGDRGKTTIVYVALDVDDPVVRITLSPQGPTTSGGAAE